MSLRATINRNVLKAFSSIGDLTKTVTLVQKDATGFDFANNTAQKTSAITTQVRCIITEKTRKDELITSLMFLSSDLNDLTMYDKVIIDGNTWGLKLPYRDNGFTTTIELIR